MAVGRPGSEGPGAPLRKPEAKLWTGLAGRIGQAQPAQLFAMPPKSSQNSLVANTHVVTKIDPVLQRICMYVIEKDHWPEDVRLFFVSIHCA